jgi:hypothetical protein
MFKKRLTSTDAESERATSAMNTIEEYALDLVADGAESTVEDDMNEDGDIADADHQAALKLALAVVRGIRANPDAILALARLTADEADSE